VIDRNGVIFWSYVSPKGVNPGADGILSALESMPHDGAGQGEPSVETEDAAATAGI
jgi:hypothetical protein